MDSGDSNSGPCVLLPTESSMSPAPKQQFEITLSVTFLGTHLLSKYNVLNGMGPAAEN